MDSIYRDKKYDNLFVAPLMSDDEDQLDENNKKMASYISRAPLYRANIVSVQEKSASKLVRLIML